MGHLDPEDAPALRFGHHVAETLHPHFAASSVPLVRVRDDALQEHGKILVVTGGPIATQTGTGTLFRLGDHCFLVSAAHVFDTIDELGQAPSVGLGEPAMPHPLRGTLYQSGEPLDVAVFLLDNSIVDGFVGKRFLTLDDVDFRADLGNGWYFVHGYPTSNSRTSNDLLTMHQLDWTYRTSLYRGSTSCFRLNDPDIHVVLDMSGQPRFSDDSTAAELPKPLGGISGSSIWLGFSEHHLMDDWTSEQAKVVAVQTNIYPDRKVIQGTRWAGVALVIWDYFPELRDLLAAHLPPELAGKLKMRSQARSVIP